VTSAHAAVIRRKSFPPSFGGSRNPFAFALRTGRAFVPVGFRPPSWRPSHFLCLHKESNQRNAPSVKRRRRSRRFAAVGPGLAAGLLPCRQRRAILARPACGARGLLRPTFAASQRGPKAKEEKARPKLRRWVPAFAGTTGWALRGGCAERGDAFRDWWMAHQKPCNAVLAGDAERLDRFR